LLDSITIRGFKSIKAIEELRLRPVNVLVGANGSGKSNFLGAFTFLRAIREGRLRDTVAAAGGAERLLHFGSKATPEMAFSLSFERGTNGYEIKLRPTADDGLHPVQESVSFRNQGFPRSYTETLSPIGATREGGISDPNQKRGVPSYVRGHLGGWCLYHVHDTSESALIRKTAPVDDDKSLRPDGSNVAAFLNRLNVQHPEEFRLITRSVQRVAPFFERFDLKPLRRNPQSIKLEWIHRGSDQYFDVSSLSDGTLRFIVLATLFLQPFQFRPSTIVVDEPELGLHPSAITLLASMISQASQQTQIIVSTQSSLFLDHFEPEDVLVADRIDQATQLRRLDSKELGDWKAHYSLGQMWEKNEFGGRP